MSVCVREFFFVCVCVFVCMCGCVREREIEAIRSRNGSPTCGFRLGVGVRLRVGWGFAGSVDAQGAPTLSHI